MAKNDKSKTGAGKNAAGRNAVRLKVTLRGVRPPIWRRLVLPGMMTLGDLHHAIQAAMGWDAGHLHAFDIAGERYGDADILEDVADEDRLTLSRIVKSGVVRFTYTYDFGDNWEHQVAIERTAPADRETAHPTCIAGKRKCPPDDCGGPWGYQHLLAVLADPAHPEHAEKMEWVDEEFDADTFDVEKASAAVAARFGRR